MNANATVASNDVNNVAPSVGPQSWSEDVSGSQPEVWQLSAGFEWTKLTVEQADIWIVTDTTGGDYSYGGTRLVPYNASDAMVLEQLEWLALHESALKNSLVNRILRHPDLLADQARWPAGFVSSFVGGARCLIRPRAKEIDAILNDPAAPLFVETISPVLHQVGIVLNKREGKIKLTPDFGHFAGLSDLLYATTPHTLGISREFGGCGGKTRYSSYGVIAALEQLGATADKSIPVTLIGAGGAMGSDILRYFYEQGFRDLVVCDLKYDQDPGLLPYDVPRLPAEYGRFTDACLMRGGLIVATTIGQELENSHWELIPSGTQFFLAHNLCVHANAQGRELLRQLMARGVYALPGQMLTLGGALTSRLEWFFRQSRSSEQLFDKPVAYAAIKKIIQLLVSEIDQYAKAAGITPYEAMLAYSTGDL